MGTIKEDQNLQWLFILIAVTISANAFPIEGWMKQPQDNLWVSLAKATGTDSLCLTMANAINPLKSCLAGIPMTLGFMWNNFSVSTRATEREFSSLALSQAIFSLKYIDSTPPEIDLISSLPTSLCFRFFQHTNHPFITAFDVSPNSPLYKKSSTKWCNDLATTTVFAEHFPRPAKLPTGFFLLCGDRTWQSIPVYPVGGPCTVGKLVLFNPAKFQLFDLNPVDQKTTINQPVRRQREVPVIPVYFKDTGSSSRGKRGKSVPDWFWKLGKSTTTPLPKTTTINYPKMQRPDQHHIALYYDKNGKLQTKKI
ncbi:hypothetical protein BTVI_64488 [Pitangus sulphuratus]|nr:hypothetical protein BTVI_64488 [Pitangus sulphuratus]